MKDIYIKMIDEALAAQRADVETIKKKRRTSFKITDAKPYVDAVNGMTAAKGQSRTVIDLLTKRYTNYVQLNPTRGPAAELHNVDFMDMIQRGSHLLEVRPIGKGGFIGGVKVDLSPIDNNEVLSNPQRYTYPACAITVRFSSLMRHLGPC